MCKVNGCNTLGLRQHPALALVSEELADSVNLLDSSVVNATTCNGHN
jgi:hypothetical protein